MKSITSDVIWKILILVSFVPLLIGVGFMIIGFEKLADSKDWFGPVAMGIVLFVIGCIYAEFEQLLCMCR